MPVNKQLSSVVTLLVYSERNTEGCIDYICDDGKKVGELRGDVCVIK
jgi:hypothetical protein